ncbi:MAG: phosphate/phosphite/phosphonate ABC transporter substrate-binding protein [Desulfobulbaceae bacterium]|nr:phosphate/phosphite/phosphonate ABC transporter substrate-binding protein [Desulfobulbaceae bacterium]
MKLPERRMTSLFFMKIFFYALCLLSLPLLLAGCDTEKTTSNSGSQKVIQLDKLAPLPPPKTTDRDDIVRVAVAAILSPTGTIDSYSPLLSYLEKTLDKPVRLIQRKTYQEINELLARGSVDIAFICTGAYKEGIKKDIMSILVVPKINGRLTYQSFLIVQASSSFKQLEDLRGKIFAFTDPMSNTGYFYPVSLLSKRGVTPESFFERTIFTYSHDRSIQAVTDGVADGASVDNLILEHAQRRNPELTDIIRVIWKSEEFGMPPVVVPKQLETNKRKAFEKFFLDIHNDEEGRQALVALGIERFVTPTLSLYDF